MSKIKQSSSTLLVKKTNSLWIELDTVDSTNNYAMGLIHEGVAQHGMTVFAHHQTQGKGQRGKSWASEPGANLSYSIIVQPSFLLPAQSFQLLSTTAVSVRNSLSFLTGDETTIKWPNDLYWRDRKTGGILIENVIRGTQWQWAIIGIGINVNQTKFKNLPNPVSIKQITGKTTDVPELAKSIYAELINSLSLLKKNGFSELHEQYNRHLYKLNEVVRLKKGPRNFETLINEVTNNGQLVTGYETKEYFDFGDIEWLA
ncbi:MAG: biotin--[acetyl-CoA-carboxylase] ligase [Lacibacter sp.]